MNMWSFFDRFGNAFWGMLYEMAPYLVIGIIAAGLVHESLGKFQRLQRFARRKSFLSLSFFNFSGLVLPICSCGTVPIAVGLRSQGVPFGNIFSFIFSSPATSIAAIILALAMLGVDFTIYYVLGAIVCSYIVGLTFFIVEPNATRPECGKISISIDAAEKEPDSQKPFLVRSLEWSTTVYGSRIAFDLILGLILVALMVSSFSLGLLASWLAELPFLVAAIFMIGLSIPLYICSLPGIMMGATMILSGVKPELVWIFLMAGPITNLGDMNVLRRRMGNVTTITYVGIVAVLTIGWGYLMHLQLDWMEVWLHVRQYFGDQAVFVSGAEVENVWRESLVIPFWPWVYWVSTVVVVLLVSFGAYLTVKELLTNPCLHCTHFQADMSLNPVVCEHPCWKKNLFRQWRSYRRRRGSGVKFDPTRQ